jgi:hypothetical protein
VTGTWPGYPLPGGASKLRIQWDLFTDFLWKNMNTPIFDDFWVDLDPLGCGAAHLNVPPLPPGTAGLKMYYAYCLGKPWEFVSNPVEITIVE